jgi:acyl-CoA reductase-like NAD-dependent aldehyde dehydrogenase
MLPCYASAIGCNQAGLGDGVLQVISHRPEDAAAIVARLIRHPLSKRINFTGSTQVGKIIAETAAQCLKPVLLELGGKAPVLILADADLDQAVEAVAFGAFFNQGQICMSTERVLVAASISERFIAKLIAKTQTLRAGNPHDPRHQLGTLESVKAAERVRALLQDAADLGALLPLGIDIQDAVMQPTLVVDVTPHMRLYREESFAPVCSIQRFDHIDQAIALANDSEFGLAAAVFSQNIAQALAVAKRIESGICHINSASVQDQAQMPFGGVKHSGYGRFGSKASIAEFTELRWLSIQTEAPHYPI